MKYVWRRGSPDRWGGVFAVMLRVKVREIVKDGLWQVRRLSIFSVVKH